MSNGGSGRPSNMKEWMNSQATFHSVPPMAPAQMASGGTASEPLEGKVLEVDVGNKKFKAIPRSPAALW